MPRSEIVSQIVCTFVIFIVIVKSRCRGCISYIPTYFLTALSIGLTNFWIFASLIGENGYLRVVQFAFLIMRNVEHLLTYSRSSSIFVSNSLQSGHIPFLLFGLHFFPQSFKINHFEMLWDLEKSCKVLGFFFFIMPLLAVNYVRWVKGVQVSWNSGACHMYVSPEKDTNAIHDLTASGDFPCEVTDLGVPLSLWVALILGHIIQSLSSIIILLLVSIIN